MALTYTDLENLPQILPDFKITSSDGRQTYTSEMIVGKSGLIVCFICNHCPYVKNILIELVKVLNSAIEQNFAVLAINSNNIKSYPEDHPHKMLEIAKKNQFGFPYVFDESQEVARTFHASCTPEFFVYNHKKELYYAGRFDDSRPGNEVEVSGKDLKFALECLLEGVSYPDKIIPSMGCNIKWK
ncbi:MAG: thioredoxin family protein [Halobacteriovoraceae bacterium]|nr:thioredoxin family protein [Halobacteriovoraceae bacterium]